MARMHSRRKGKSGSTKPLKKKKITWLSYKTQEVEKLVVKLAKTGKSKSEIGIILRDSYGIPDVQKITSKKINKILEENQVEQKLPEDLMFLIKKQANILKHLEKNKKDMVSSRGLQLTKSKIRRLIKYYKKIKKLPEEWNYDAEKLQMLSE